jgi:hypothetical protein
VHPCWWITRKSRILALIGENVHYFFTLFFTKKASEKPRQFQALFGLFKNVHLEKEKVVKTL